MAGIQTSRHTSARNGQTTCTANGQQGHVQYTASSADEHCTLHDCKWEGSKWDVVQFHEIAKQTFAPLSCTLPSSNRRRHGLRTLSLLHSLRSSESGLPAPHGLR